MRLISILGAYTPCSSNYCFHLGMFIACWLLAPGHGYKGPADPDQCNPMDFLNLLKWMHLGIFLTTTFEYWVYREIAIDQ